MLQCYTQYTLYRKGMYDVYNKAQCQKKNISLYKGVFFAFLP